MCVRGARLRMIEDKLDMFVDEEEDEVALPPTGGFATTLVLGLLLTGSGVLLAKHSREQ